MFLTEYDQDKVLEQQRLETERITHEQVATDMIKEKLPLSLIAKISKLSEEAILKIAQSLGISVAR